MISVEFKVSIDVLADNVVAAELLGSPEVQDYVDLKAKVILARQQHLVPVDTGELYRGLGIRKTPDGLGREIGAFGVRHAVPVELGHETKAGTFVPAQPYIRPSVDAARD